MKRFTYFVIFIFICSVLQAQKYLRYTMKDGSFNGFYSECVDSILHSIEDGIHKSFIFSSGIKYTIPTDNILNIEIENAIPNVDDYGEYRLYELNCDNERIKKVFVDNRATLCASTSGEFGANDTILVSSAYSGIEMLIITDSEGRFKKLFVDDVLLWFDYDVEYGANIVLQTKEGYTEIPVETFTYDSRKRVSGISAISKIANFFKTNKAITAFLITPRGKLPNYVERTLSNAIGLFTKMATIVAEVDSNPELRNQCVLLDILSIGGDAAGIIAALAAEPVSGGTSTIAVPLLCADLLANIDALYNHLFPNDSQMEVYRDYYKRKYGINIVTLPATDKTCTGATLNGSITSIKELKGQLYFSVEPISKTIMSNGNKVSDGLWSFNSSINDLDPGNWYRYYAGYRIVVDGLELIYSGDNQTFTTLVPVALSNFKVTKAQYKENGFENDGIKYDYCFDVSVTATLNTEDVSYITDWGYVYEDLNGDTAHISLETMGSPYTDTRYSYYRNEPESYARLYGYVKYYGDDSFYHGEKTDYPLIYDKQPEATTLEPTCIDETWATIKCAYKESAPWNGICGVEYWKDNDHKEILFELAQDKELEISLTGLSPNTVYCYRAFIKIDDKYIYAEDIQTIKTSQEISAICPDDNHPHLIDLGLPSGTKWQCCNVDAQSPIESGGYYAWGETYEKSVYNRYTHSGDAVISDSHDIAYVVSNGQTRMPTRTQIQEILNSCSWTWESHNGVLGAMVTAPNGNAIFLPAASFKDSNRSENLGAPYGTYGSYWGRDLGGVVNYGRTPTLVGTELIFGILDGNIGFVPSNYYYTWGNTGWVYCGRSIRPVSAETEQEYEFTLSTQEPVEVEAETAIVNCYFKGFKEKNGVCGVQYWDDYNTYEVTIDATEDGVQEILLEGLTANTQYHYRAFVQIGNINIYADETLMFQTKSVLYSGANHPQK